MATGSTLDQIVASAAWSTLTGTHALVASSGRKAPPINARPRAIAWRGRQRVCTNAVMGPCAMTARSVAPVKRTNLANTSWLFRAFGEAGVHGLFDSVAMGNPWAAKG